MNQRIEILVEELSMQVFLNGLLPRILPPAFGPGVNCFVYAIEGKQDLLRRLPKRLQAYRNYPEEVLPVVFMIRIQLPAPR